MNKLWVLLPLALATTPVLAQSCVLTGTITGIGARPIVFSYEQGGKQRRDTVRAVHDKFTYTAQPSDDGRVDLFIVRSQFTPFWYEPGRLTVAGNAAQPGLLTVTGAPENNTFAEYQRTIEQKYALQKQAPAADAARLRVQEGLATLAFVAGHPAARTSAHLLYWQTLYNDKKLPEYERLFKQLTPAVQRSPQGQQVAQRLLALRNQPTVGRPVADFSMADTAGIKHSLTSYRGQYVLLDFWGHWCSPCIKAMPTLNAMHTQYADKLVIIGIAMESPDDLPAWKQAIRKHAVPGLQLSELHADDGPVILGYNVTAFPTYLLLDRQGRLLLRTNDLASISKKLLTLADL